MAVQDGAIAWEPRVSADHPGSLFSPARDQDKPQNSAQQYGFYEECIRKYGNSNAWRYCVEVFDHLNLSAVISDRVLCVHGGLSPELRTMDQVGVIARAQEIPQEGALSAACVRVAATLLSVVADCVAFCDLMWSDPEENTDTWRISPRGAGYIFGATVTDEFNHVNGSVWMGGDTLHANIPWPWPPATV